MFELSITLDPLFYISTILRNNSGPSALPCDIRLVMRDLCLSAITVITSVSSGLRLASKQI